jgi:membrane protein
LQKVRYFPPLKRAIKRAFKEDDVPDAAAAIAYYGFLAIPSLLLVAVGFFGLWAGPDTIRRVVDKLGEVVPSEAVTLVQTTLTNVTENRSGGLVMVIVGFVLAAWTVSGAMGAVMRALNRVHRRKEERGFVVQRGTGLVMVVLALIAIALVFGLLVLGPVLSGWVGGLVGAKTAVSVLWWVGQWPILLVGLAVAFALIFWLGPDRERPRFRPLTAGAMLATLVWLVASGAFAVYVSMFSSYNKAWGSLAAVIVMLTWLWLSALALLIGAELDAELEGHRNGDS